MASSEPTLSLIDLSTEESTNNETKPPIPLQPDDMFISFNQRDSLDNNPFDHALKQVCLLNDPFEIVFNEQRKCDTDSIASNSSNVRTANLIGLIDDTCKPTGDSPNCSQVIKSSDVSNVKVVCSPIIDTPNCSPIINSSDPNLESKSTNNSLLVISKDLISSISNSDVTKISNKSPNKIRSTSLDATAQRLKLLKLSFINSPNNSPATGQLTNESNSIEDSFDDHYLMNEQINLVDSDADSDIEQMKIPFLKKELKSSKLIDDRKIPAINIEEQLEKLKSVFIEDKEEEKIDETAENENRQPSSKNIDSLLDDLKKVVNQCENEKTKSDATALLTNLSEALNCVGQNNADDSDSKPIANITRQGTFNMDEIDDGIEKPIQIDHVPNVQCETPPLRSRSLSVQVKPNSVVAAIQAKHQNQRSENSFTTPIRSTVPRRNSFSARPERPNPARHSIYSIKDESPKNVSKLQLTPMRPLKNPQRQSMTPSKPPTVIKHQPTITAPQSSYPGGTKMSHHMGNISGSRLRVRTSECRTATGPLKATIPIKAVAPLHISSTATTLKHSLPHTSTPKTIDAQKIRTSNSTAPVINFHKASMLPGAATANGIIANRRMSSISTPVKNHRTSFVSVTPNPVKFGRIGRQRSLTNLNTQSLYTAANMASYGSDKVIDQNSMIVRNQSTRMIPASPKFRAAQSIMYNKENKTPLRK